MSKNTSILPGAHVENFIAEEISSGKFNSASEVIRTVLRLLELEEQKTKHLKRKLELGEISKIINSFDPESHVQKLRKKAIEDLKKMRG